MNIELFPVKVEGYSAGDGIFTVEAQDEGIASVSITVVTNASEWEAHIAPAITQALRMMRLEEDVA